MIAQPESMRTEDESPTATEPSSLTRRAVRGGTILMASRLLVQLFRWAVTLLVARLLTPDDYGVMTAGMLFIGVADILAEAGVGNAIIQKEKLTADDVAGTFTFSLVLAVGLYLGLSGLAVPAGWWFAMPELGLLLPVLGVIILLVPLRMVPLALLDRDLAFGPQAVVNVVSSVLMATAVLGLAYFGAGYWAPALGSVLSQAIAAAMLAVAAGWRPRLLWPRRDHRDMVCFGIQVSGSSLLAYAYSNLDFAVVGKLFGATVLGYYSVAFQLMSLPVQKLSVNISQVAYPVFCRLQGDLPRLRAGFLRLSVLLGLFSLPALAGMALVADDAIPLILGARWRPVVVPFQILSVVGILMVYSAMLPPLFNALGRPDITLRYTGCCAVVLPLGFYVGGQLGGVNGVCLAWLVLYPLLVGMLLTMTRSITSIGLLDLLGAQLPVLAAAGVMSGVVLGVRQVLADEDAAAIRLVAAIAAGALSYAATILVLGRQTVVPEMRALLRKLRGRS